MNWKWTRRATELNMECPSHCLSGGTEDNHKIFVRIACLKVKIAIQNLLNTKQECYPLNHDVHDVH
jgi:hypothetical protein